MNSVKKQILRDVGMGHMVDRVEKERCPFCNTKIRLTSHSILEESFRDAQSFKEYEVSGLCQKCQDSVWEGSDGRVDTGRD